MNYLSWWHNTECAGTAPPVYARLSRVRWSPASPAASARSARTWTCVRATQHCYCKYITNYFSIYIYLNYFSFYITQISTYLYLNIYLVIHPPCPHSTPLAHSHSPSGRALGWEVGNVKYVAKYVLYLLVLFLVGYIPIQNASREGPLFPPRAKYIPFLLPLVSFHFLGKAMTL